MGYTIYWLRPAKLPADPFAAAVDDFRQMLPLLNVALAGPHGKGSPVLDSERLAFNGQSPRCCESFDFRREESDRHNDGVVRSFCKTQRLPYDLCVKVALLFLRRHLGELLTLSSDGEDAEWHDARRLVRAASLPAAVAEYINTVVGQLMVEDCVWFRWNIAHQKIETAGNLLPSEWPHPIEEIRGTMLFEKTPTGWKMR